jgi:hypothetical protein
MDARLGDRLVADIAYAPGRARPLRCRQDHGDHRRFGAVSPAWIEAVIADYAASSERVEAVIGRLMASNTYVENLEGWPMSHLSHPSTMIAFLDHLSQRTGASGRADQDGLDEGTPTRSAVAGPIMSAGWAIARRLH